MTDKQTIIELAIDAGFNVANVINENDRLLAKLTQFAELLSARQGEPVKDALSVDVILEYLKQRENTVVCQGSIVAIKLFSDGSGRIEDISNDIEWAEFNNITELKALHALINTSPPSQAQTQDDEIVALKCPYCDDDGFTVEADSNGEATQCQCEFCYTVPNSIFNLRESIEQALQQGENNG